MFYFLTENIKTRYDKENIPEETGFQISHLQAGQKIGKKVENTT